MRRPRSAAPFAPAPRVRSGARAGPRTIPESNRIRPGTRADPAPPWVAFLRGINVGGHKTVPMPTLVRRFESAGLRDVRAYRASGNVLFRAPAKTTGKLPRRIEDALAPLFDAPVRVFVRSTQELRELLDLRPVSTSPGSSGAEYVTFVEEPPKTHPALPLRSPAGDIEILAIVGANVLSRTFPVPGRSAFPNAFVERLLHAPATTRNWRTIEGLASPPTALAGATRAGGTIPATG